MSDYGTDFYRWTQKQAAALRAKDFAALDLENLAEEIESLGRSDRFTLKAESQAKHTLSMREPVHEAQRAVPPLWVPPVPAFASARPVQTALVRPYMLPVRGEEYVRYYSEGRYRVQHGPALDREVPEGTANGSPFGALAGSIPDYLARTAC